MSKKLFQLSAAGLLALGLAVSSASAMTEELTNPVTGADSGWAATIPDSLVGQLDLVYKGTVGSDFFIEKDATFNSNDMGGLEITFTKTAATADTLVINDESIINNSGTSWGGFTFELGTGTNTGGTPGFAFTTTSGSAIGTGPNDFDISPFTSFAFSDQNTVLSMAGGTIGNGDVWMPGATSQSGLAIVASGDLSSFVLKEIPNAIPLPAAAWTGLSTLLGLGLIGVAKNARKLLA